VPQKGTSCPRSTGVTHTRPPSPQEPSPDPAESQGHPICHFALRPGGGWGAGWMCPLPCSQTPSQVEPDAPHGTGPCVGTMMCRRVLVSAVNPPPRPLQANLAGSRGLFARSQIWLTRCEYCSHWPVLRTAGCARPQAILGCEASRMRSRIVENQPWRSRDLGPTNALLVFCWGPALLSARRYVYAQRTPREGYTHGANGVLQVPDGRRPWPPGPCLVPNWGRRVCFFNFWAGWPGGSPAWTHSPYTPIQSHNPDLNIVHRVCVCAS
jgi:hypothetical protein